MFVPVTFDSLEPRNDPEQESLVQLEEDVNLASLKPDTRLANNLKRADIVTVNEALKDLQSGKYISWRNIGPAQVSRLLSKFRALGYISEDFRLGE